MIIDYFLILPYLTQQDIVFFSTLKDNSKLINMAYADIVNRRIDKNLVHVVRERDELFVFHIYPIKKAERISGRTGRLMTIGYKIKQKDYINNETQIICDISMVFSKIKGFCYDIKENDNVVDSFVEKVDMKSYNVFFKKELSEINNPISFISCESEIKHKKIISLYRFIMLCSKRNKSYWICYRKECLNKYLFLDNLFLFEI